MSKMDGLRAMREARYAEAAARAATGTPRPAPKVTATPTVAAASPPDLPDPPDPESAPCGHRAISGRTCTREAGHAAKSHRYT
jgi:hypothetical protein